MLPALVMHVRIHDMRPPTLEQRRADPNENGQSNRRPAAVLTLKIFRHEIDRAPGTNSQGGPAKSGPLAHVSERQRAHIKSLPGQSGGQRQLLPRLSNVLEPAEDGVGRVQLKIRFQDYAVLPVPGRSPMRPP